MNTYGLSIYELHNHPLFPRGGGDGAVIRGCWFCPSEHRGKVLTAASPACTLLGQTLKLPGRVLVLLYPPEPLPLPAGGGSARAAEQIQQH